MTKEDKELLFKDLSARLPYHIRCKVWLKDGTTEEGLLDLQHNYNDVLLSAFYYNKIVDIKPYLRPMLSMTKEERKEFRELQDWHFEFTKHSELFTHRYGAFNIDTICCKTLDWLNANNFDYRGLIDKGLALEATEGMYNIKDK